MRAIALLLKGARRFILRMMLNMVTGFRGLSSGQHYDSAKNFEA